MLLLSWSPGVSLPAEQHITIDNKSLLAIIIIMGEKPNMHGGNY